MEQRTLEWQRARWGNITGSCVGKLIGKSGAMLKTGMTYIYKVAGQRLTDERIVEDDVEFEELLSLESYESKEMRWGTEQEPAARFEFEMESGYYVEECGSITTDEIANFSSSPDGLIDDDGCLEIKCPTLGTHAMYRATLKSGADLLDVKPEYYWQCLSHLLVTGRKWCAFVSFHPNAKPYARLHKVLVERDEERIEQLKNVINEANAKIDEIIE